MKRKIIENYIIENKDKLYRIAYTYAKNKEDALDIVQESILKAFKSAHSLKNTDHIKTWYYKILTRTAIDLIRKNSRCVPLDNDYVFDNQGKWDNYTDIDLEKAMNMLNYEQRIVITLRFFEDMKIKDIAEVTGENISTIKTRLYKALETLRISIKEDYYE